MIMERKELRPKTAREKEWETQPFCPYDPLELERCNNHVYPPENVTCDKCLSNRMVQALDDRCTSYAMQLFIAYKRFRQKLLTDLERE